MASARKSWGAILCSGLSLVGSGLLAWLAMQIVHELGHVLAAWGTGGTVTRVLLHPLAISETSVHPNPHPLTEVAAGPLIGIAFPCVLWGVALACKSSFEPPLRLFAGFCLIANGAYIGSAVFDAVGDAFELVQLGVPRWLLGLFGILTVPLGLWLWDGISSRFGIGSQSTSPSWRSVALIWGLLITVVVVECLCSPVPSRP